MQLRKPMLDDKEKLKDYVEEHHANSETSISASNGIPTMPYEDWLVKLKQDESVENKEWGISKTYILEDNDKVIGMLNIRYTLSNEMAEVILSCYEDNIGSNKTIINNYGVIYIKSKMKDKESLYYKIKL